MPIPRLIPRPLCPVCLSEYVGAAPTASSPPLAFGSSSPSLLRPVLQPARRQRQGGMGFALTASRGGARVVRLERYCRSRDAMTPGRGNCAWRRVPSRCRTRRLRRASPRRPGRWKQRGRLLDRRRCRRKQLFVPAGPLPLERTAHGPDPDYGPPPTCDLRHSRAFHQPAKPRQWKI